MLSVHCRVAFTRALSAGSIVHISFQDIGRQRRKLHHVVKLFRSNFSSSRTERASRFLIFSSPILWRRLAGPGDISVDLLLLFFPPSPRSP